MSPSGLRLLLLPTTLAVGGCTDKASETDASTDAGPEDLGGPDSGTDTADTTTDDDTSTDGSTDTDTDDDSDTDDDTDTDGSTTPDRRTAVEPEGPWVAFDGHPDRWCAANAAGEIGCFGRSGYRGFRCFSPVLDSLEPVESVSVPFDPVLDGAVFGGGSTYGGSYAVAAFRSDSVLVWGGWCHGSPSPWPGYAREHGLEVWSVDQLLTLGEWSIVQGADGLESDHSCLGDPGFLPDFDASPMAVEDAVFYRSNAWGVCAVDTSGVARCGGFVPEASYAGVEGKPEGVIYQPEYMQFDNADRDVTTGYLFVCTLDEAGVARCHWATEITRDDTWDFWELGLPAPPDLTPPDGVRFTDIEAGTRHVCGLTEDRSIVCWGDTESFDTTTLPGPFQDISPWCGLTDAGEIECVVTMRRSGFCADACDETGCDGLAGKGEKTYDFR